MRRTVTLAALLLVCATGARAGASPTPADAQSLSYYCLERITVSVGPGVTTPRVCVPGP